MRLRNKCALLFVCLLFCKGNEITTSKISFCDFTVILNIVNERSDSVKIILHQKKKHFGFITGDNSDNSEADGAKWFDTLFVAANDSVLDTIQSNSEPDENRQIKTCSFDCDGPQDFYGWNELVINAYSTDGATVLGVDTFAVCTEWEDPDCEVCGTHYQLVAVP